MRFSVSHFISSSFPAILRPHSVLAFVLLWLPAKMNSKRGFCLTLTLRQAAE
ncbi:hypothetical protein CNR480_04166 [Klebsiella pneumoniae]|nr:hypothetical protein VK055_0209 [Klebsiella pneumoniae subsp. pneumoniae]AJB31907.1 hypothetical protein P244_1982 [Klebsiella pneumoniae HK787]AJC04172.1 hypothetical protein P243_2100 [Klebsiella pneumoniae subsp. pneumoniae 1158]SPR88541.1 hypothetical protein CNR480_04166 [Klebsiella pneumoniae]